MSQLSKKDRRDEINFIVEAITQLEGVDAHEIDTEKFEAMTDEELVKEADWYEELLGK